MTRDEFSEGAIDIVGTVEDFLRAGGRVMIDAQGELHHQLPLSFPFDDWLRPTRTMAARRAGQALRELCEADRSRRLLKWIVTARGQPGGNGWLVLEATGGAGRSPTPRGDQQSS